jgi:hypothetical protein
MRYLKNVAPENGYTRRALWNQGDKQTDKIRKRSTKTVIAVLLEVVTTERKTDFL